ncbi:hypothetical protein, partial [Christiangramia aquimixticola]|uniref:hypothetical protein n=1 Tax=Christiangramia aquimixticola TaxID=1697558 RepID=UPI003AA898D8
EDCRKPIDDHNRVFDHMEKHQGLHPEKSIDEDPEWAHEDRNLEDIADPHRKYDSKKSDFYDRREFHKRR